VSDQRIDRTELPIRRPPFRGVVQRTLDGSQPDWDYVAPLSPPQGAPNILLILTDDADFGNPATFGGPIRTPALDRLAAGGLRYNRFHVTAMCSPTRAALMTGRNHHAVGFGMVSEFAGPFPATKRCCRRTARHSRGPCRGTRGDPGRRTADAAARSDAGLGLPADLARHRRGTARMTGQIQIRRFCVR
jgi:Sulfatase